MTTRKLYCVKSKFSFLPTPIENFFQTFVKRKESMKMMHATIKLRISFCMLSVFGEKQFEKNYNCGRKFPFIV